MGRRGPQPDYARREAFAKLITEGVSSKEACRFVGIHPRTGIEWRNGRRRLRRVPRRESWTVSGLNRLGMAKAN
jgi:transposase